MQKRGFNMMLSKAETIKPKTQRKIAKALKVDVNVVFDV